MGGRHPRRQQQGGRAGGTHDDSSEDRRVAPTMTAVRNTPVWCVPGCTEYEGVPSVTSMKPNVGYQLICGANPNAFKKERDCYE